ncbi:MAG: carboxypeptidase-like regulatory domain-containing protein [Terriglobia bacterium]
MNGRLLGRGRAPGDMALLALLVLALCPFPLFAASGIQGRVVNGTTNRGAAGQTVQLLNPGKDGMREVASTRTEANGHFAFAGSAIQPGTFYLLQAVYEGVSYHQPVRLNGNATTTENLKIYDASLVPPHLVISSARFLVSAKGDKVDVEELYGIRNTATPAVAYANPAGTFSFNLGRSANQPSVDAVGELNMPLPQDVRPGGAPGQYSVQYPIKPGLTVVIVTYQADYAGQTFSLSDAVPYSIDQLELDVTPRTLKVQSALLKPAGNDADSGGEKLVAQNLPPGAAIEAAFSGPPVSGATQAGAEEQTIKELPNPMTRLGAPLLGCFLLVLLWAMGVRISKEWARNDAGRSGRPAQKQLEDKIEKLVDSIVNLDELFESGKVPEKRYWRERLDLKAKLVVLLKSSPPVFLESYVTRHNPS